MVSRPAAHGGEAVSAVRKSRVITPEGRRSLRVAAERRQKTYLREYRERRQKAIDWSISEYGEKWCFCPACGHEHRAGGRSRAVHRCLDCEIWALRLQMDAKAAVGNAIRSGQLPAVTDLACADCGKPAQEYDHRDYYKPLAVEPTCKSCNRRRGPAHPLRAFHCTSASRRLLTEDA